MSGFRNDTDHFNQSDADLINDSGLAGDTTTGQVTLTDANTWYAIPTTAPNTAYQLEISKESVSGAIRRSYSNSSSPSATFGNKWYSYEAVFVLGANQVLYVSSSEAGDTINFTTKEIIE